MAGSQILTVRDRLDQGDSRSRPAAIEGRGSFSARVRVQYKSSDGLIWLALINPDQGWYVAGFELGKEKEQGTLLFPPAWHSPWPPSPTSPLPWPGSAEYRLKLDARWDDLFFPSPLSRNEARALVVQVEEAFQGWQSVREDPAARIFLAALLLQRQWNR